MSRNVLRLVAVVAALVAAWLLVLRPATVDNSTLPGTNVPAPLVLPTSTDTLDLEVVGTLEHDVVHAVELRPAPDHRILALTPATGEVVTVRSFTNLEQTFGIARAPSGDQLAVAYVADVSTRGNGLWVLALDDPSDFREVIPAVTGVYLTDPLWMDDDRLLLTRTDVRVGDPSFDLVAVEVSTGAVTPVVNDAVTAAVVDGIVHFLEPDEQANGRAVRRLGEDGGISPVVRADGDATIDHLLATADGGLLFAVHQVDEGGITVGAPALAHVGPSVWWTTPAVSPAPADWGLPSSSVLDAAMSREGALVAVDRQGLSITRDGVRHRLLDSRSLVFVAA